MHAGDMGPWQEADVWTGTRQGKEKRETRGKGKERLDFMERKTRVKGRESPDLKEKGKNKQARARARENGGDHTLMAKAIRDIAMPVGNLAIRL